MISTKLEDEIKGIPDILYFSSSSVKGTSVVVVAVRDTLPDDKIDQVWIELREAVSRAARFFPPGTGDPQIDTDGIASYSAVVSV